MKLSVASRIGRPKESSETRPPRSERGSISWRECLGEGRTNFYLAIVAVVGLSILSGCGSAQDDGDLRQAEFMPALIGQSLREAVRELKSAKIEWQVDDTKALADATHYTVCTTVPKPGEPLDGKTATLLVQAGSKCPSGSSAAESADAGRYPSTGPIPPDDPDSRVDDTQALEELCSMQVDGVGLSIQLRRGEVECQTARKVWREYKRRAPSEGEGSSGFVEMGSWGCSSPPATEVLRQGTCENIDAGVEFSVYGD